MNVSLCGIARPQGTATLGHHRQDSVALLRTASLSDGHMTLNEWRLPAALQAKVAVLCVQVQEEVARLQSAVSDQLPQERQRRQQRLQAVHHALEGSGSAEVRVSNMAMLEGCCSALAGPIVFDRICRSKITAKASAIAFSLF